MQSGAGVNEQLKLSSKVAALVCALLCLSMVGNAMAKGKNAAQETSKEPLILSLAEHGIVPNDCRDDAGRLQAMLDYTTQLDPQREVIIGLPQGRLLLHSPLVIRRSGIKLLGAGPQRSWLVSRIHSAEPTAVITVQGNKGKRIGRLTAEVSGSKRELPFWAEAGTLKNVDAVWLGAPNTDDIYSRKVSWKREYPWLRQWMGALCPAAERNASGSTKLCLQNPPQLALPAETEVRKPELLSGVELSGFSIIHKIAGQNPAMAEQLYKNAHPKAMVDGIKLDWSHGARVANVAILMAGRHPLVIENSLSANLSRMFIQGAWNKGKGGAGYVRFARTYDSQLVESRIQGIRHLTFQWSSANNRVVDSEIGVDVNFHGGLSHHNQVLDSIINPPAHHPWGKVTRTSATAGWAPPDGPGNTVTELYSFQQAWLRARLPERPKELEMGCLG